MTKLISGRIAKVDSANVSADRYQFIGLSETEPDLGLPAVSGYVLSSDRSGNRIWVDAASASGTPYFANTSGTANVALTANIANTVLTLSNFTTANLVEGINLYYTNARVLSAVTPYLTTANVLESASNLYYTNARVYAAIQGNLALKANVSDLTTANVSELTNLYYTNARVYAAIAGNLATKANTTDLTTANVSELTNLYYTNARVVSAVLPYLTTSNVNEGSNLYYTNTRVNAFVQPYLTTANVSEVNNLYYTNARVRSTLSGGTGVLYDTANGIISIGQNVSTTANVQFSNVKVTNIISTSGDIFVGGNLIPSENAVFNFGSPTNVWKDFYLSATSLFVGNTKVSSNTSTGGLSVTTAAGQATDFTAANIFAGNATVSGLIYGNLIGTVSTLSNFTTSNLAEGINLYYTNARVISAVTPYLTTANVKESSSNLYYTNARVISAVTPYLTTANVKESSSNLYYTNARVISAVLPYLTTSNVAEGSNLYYTNARVYSNVISTLAGNITIGNATIGNVSVSGSTTFGAGSGGSLTGANLLSASYIQTGNLLATSGNILITGNIIPSLDSTFNFGSLDKQWKDFYLSAESLYVGGQKLSGNTETGLTVVNLTASNITTGNLVVTRSLIANVIGTVNSLSNFTTSNLTEGTNQYFTNARVISAFSSYLTTANVAESNSNLYYTNARVTANLEQQSVNVFADVDITGIQTNGILTWNGTKFIAGTIDTGAQANTALFAYNANVANTVLSLSGLTTANLAESNVNLYFTNTRVVSALIAGENVKIEANGRISANVDTANVTFLLTNVADIALRVVNIENQTTSNLREGTNLYYTNTRVLSALLGNVTIGNLVTGTSVSNSYVTSGNVTAGNVIANGAFFGSGVGGSVTGANLISATNIQANSWLGLYTANVIESNSALYYTNARVLSIVTPLLTTSNVIEGSNLYYTNARVVSAVLPYLTTSNVAEGSNLYYTNTRVRSALSGGTGVSYDTTTGAISIGQNVASTANVTFYNVSVTNNLIVYGGVTTYGANNVSISDNMIYLNSDSTVSNPDIGFAFNYNDGVYRHGGFFRDASDNGTFKVFENYYPEPDANIFIDTTDASFRLANIAATIFFGNVSGTAGSLSNFTTANLAEGTNLYYTNARVNSYIQGNLATKANVTDLTTSNVVEGTNLYYTNARVNSYIQGNLATKANVTDLTTSNVVEGTNLYYTNARVNSFIQGNLATKANVTDLTTANVSELTNLYYTNSRVSSNVILLLPSLAGQNVTIEANGRISANVDTSNITVLQANVVALAAQVISLSNQTTSNIAEGTNLYYTNTRAVSAFSEGSGIAISAGGVISARGDSAGSGLFNSGIQLVGNTLAQSTFSNVKVFSFAEGNTFIGYSFHVTNITSNIVYLTGRHVFDSNTTLFANLLEMPVGSSMEVFRKPQVFRANDIIQIQGFDQNRTAVNNGISSYLSYQATVDDTYQRAGNTITGSALTTIYQTVGRVSIFESINLVNLSPNVIYGTVIVTDGSDNLVAYLAANLAIPAYASVDVCEYPKTLLDDYKIKVQKSDNYNPLSVFTSSKFTQSFAVTPSSNNMTESGIITLDLVTTNIVNGTVLYYAITGASGNINQTDFVTNTTGTVTVQNNAVRLTLQANADLNTNLEGDETFTVVYRKNSNVGTVVATSSSIVLRDTSNVTSYTLTSNATSVLESTDVLFTLSTINLPPGTTYYWNTSGNATSSNFVTGNTGSFISNANTSYNIVLAANAMPAATSTDFQLRILTGSQTGNVVSTSNVITIVDSSLAYMSVSGGTITDSGGYRTHAFTSTANLVISRLGVSPTYNTVDYVVVAGGGAGGSYYGGGGGAGGLLTSNLALSSTGNITVTVGAGGATAAASGSNTTLSGITSLNAVGGGNGMSGGGGSGGGGGGGDNYPGGAGVPGQGYPGGNNTWSFGGGAGGGGGSSQVGGAGSPAPANPQYAGYGGNGSPVSWVTSSYGTAGPAPGRWFAAGGGGGSYGPGRLFGVGGAGGGGDGGAGNFGGTPGVTGTIYTGSGGGGRGDPSTNAGLGGSGIVIIRYPYVDTINLLATGGSNITIANGYKTHIFDTTANLNVTSLGVSGNIEVLVVAGGGGGGAAYQGGGGGGGGGAGGFRTSNLTLSSTGNILVTVGGGGAYNGTSPALYQDGGSGSPSIFSTITSTGGGGGGNRSPGLPGGSGGGWGGGGGGSPPVGLGNTPATSPPQGNPGGLPGPGDCSGGGGGSSTPGNPGGPAPAVGGAGGTGSPASGWDIPSSYGVSGPAPGRWFSGGGGAGGNIGNGAGGAGGGGQAAPVGSPAGTSGTPTTGGGGGGATGGNYPGTRAGSGGSGIVVVRYPYSL